MDELDLVVFDMVGTTVRATDWVPVAFHEAFEKVGVTLSDEEVQSVRGRSKREAISELLTRHLLSSQQPMEWNCRPARSQRSLPRLARRRTPALPKRMWSRPLATRARLIGRRRG